MLSRQSHERTEADHFIGMKNRYALSTLIEKMLTVAESLTVLGMILLTREGPPDKWRHARNVEPSAQFHFMLWKQREAKNSLRKESISNRLVDVHPRNCLSNHPRKAALVLKSVQKLPP